jgi:hypothetical protein
MLVKGKVGSVPAFLLFHQSINFLRRDIVIAGVGSNIPLSGSGQDRARNAGLSEMRACDEMHGGNADDRR